MRFDDRKINSIGELIENLKIDYSKYSGEIWFRGQSDSNWKLIPSINRNGEHSEMDLINRFKQNATLIINQHPSPSPMEWLFLMRHYGVPTRLLDWSESPLVAAYFATIEENMDKDGVIWVMLPLELNKLANIEPEYPTEIPSFGCNNILQSYEPDDFFLKKLQNFCQLHLLLQETVQECKLNLVSLLYIIVTKLHLKNSERRNIFGDI
jgi:hypothetical protein